MSEVKKENPLVIKGIKTFKKNDNAPDFVVCDGVCVAWDRAFGIYIFRTTALNKIVI